MLVLTLQCGLETVAVSTDDQSVVDFESDDTRHMEAILEAPTNHIITRCRSLIWNKEQNLLRLDRRSTSIDHRCDIFHSPDGDT